MIQVTPQMRVVAAVEPVDFRRGIDGLARLCKDVLKHDPFSGWVFVFRNRSAKALKILVYGKCLAEHVLLAVLSWVRPTTRPGEVWHGRVEQVETGRDTRVLGRGDPALSRGRSPGWGVLQS